MNIKLGMLEPRAEEYSYTFSVSNNDNAKRTETSLEYDLKIITTTNLPLTYEVGTGGHTWEFWDFWLLRIIDWMGLSSKKEDE